MILSANQGFSKTGMLSFFFFKKNGDAFFVKTKQLLYITYSSSYSAYLLLPTPTSDFKLIENKLQQNVVFFFHLYNLDPYIWAQRPNNIPTGR
jgi:hypothetical protein